MQILKYVFLGIISVSALVGCNHQKRNTQKLLVNPEYVGRWTDSSGCNLELANDSNRLKLVYFSNGQQHYADVFLEVQKDGIFTRIQSESSTGIAFSGIFSEGFLMIDNKLCKQALHKDSNQ